MDKQKRKNLGLSIGVSLVLVAGAIIAAVMIHNKNQEYNELRVFSQKLELANQSLSTELNTRDSVINDLLSGFDEIATNLESVRQRRNLVTAKTGEVELTADKREAIIKDIQMMNSLLDDSKNKIARLNSKLKNSGMQTEELQKKIDGLNKIIEVQTADIAQLKETLTQKDFEMAQMNENLDSLEMTILQKNDVIEHQTDDMNRAYYAYGTYKELKEKGLLTKEGGFLFLGQNKSIKEDFNEDYFTEIDISQVKTIPVNSKKAELITEHPAGSYKMVEDSGHIAYLEIENPEEFWKISRYVVLEVKN